eukprot:3937697-Rhodomonas_salina.1
MLSSPDIGTRVPGYSESVKETLARGTRVHWYRGSADSPVPGYRQGVHSDWYRGESARGTLVPGSRQVPGTLVPGVNTGYRGVGKSWVHGYPGTMYPRRGMSSKFGIP